MIHIDHADRLAVFGRPESADDRVSRYMRDGASQYAASVGAWSWPSYCREHNALAVEAARAWGKAADLVLDQLDIIALNEWILRSELTLTWWQAEWVTRLRRRVA